MEIISFFHPIKDEAAVRERIMEEAKKDRRVKYTIAMLKDALVRAMATEHISKISVKSLCELADINRSTFYAHFDDQYALLRYIEREVMDNVKQALKNQDFDDKRPISFQVLHRILEYVRENADLFKALLSENCEPGIQRELMNFSQVISFHLINKYDQRLQDYLTIYATTGCISLIQKWLQDGMPESTMQITEYILQMLYKGMASFE